MIQEFKAFIMRGNIVDLAVAVIIGVAFGLVITAFTNGVLMAFVAAIFGKPNFDAITFSVGDGKILIGSFLTALVNFLIIAFVLFMVLKAMTAATTMRSKGKEDMVEETPAPSDEAVLLTEIRDLLSGAAGQQ